MCGCGIVAALDLLLCLQGQGFDAGLRVSDAAGSDIAGYEAAAKMLRRRYLPFFSPIGVTGWTLAWGLNRYFKERGLPFRGRWRMMRRESWKDVEKMLAQNLPVILSIGPNLPLFWKREGVRFDADDVSSSVSISGHYLTVTALEGEKLTAASWGRSFTTSVDLYEAYCRKGLNRLFCGRLQLEKKSSAVK